MSITDILIRISITLLVASAGSFIAMRCKVPAGVLLGAVISVILLNVFTRLSYFPPYIKVVSASLIGVFLGCGIKKEDARQIRYFLLPACVMMGGMLAYNFVSGFLFLQFVDMDLKSVVFAFAPGGVVDMTMAAMDVGANMTFVSSAQVFRLLTIIIVTPFSAQFFLRYMKSKGYAAKTVDEKSPGSSASSFGGVFSMTPKQRRNLLLTVTVGLTFGIMGYFSGFPAGTICFSMLAVAVMNVKTGRGYMPLGLCRVAQVVSGILIGMQISPKDFEVLYGTFAPVFLIVCGWLILNVVLSLLVYRMTDISLTSAFFATSPGGMTDLGIIVAEMGGNPAHVLSFHIFRQICLLTLYPAAAQWIIPILIN